MSTRKEKNKRRFDLPSAEKVQEELSKAESMDDFFGKDGIFAKLFATTMEQMLEAELSDHLGYEKYAAKGRNSGNNRNGHYEKKLRTSNGDVQIEVPRDRNGTFEPQVVPKYGRNTNELEEKILGMYARGVSTRDIQDALTEMYGVDVSPSLISKVTDKVWETVEAPRKSTGTGVAKPTAGSHLPDHLSGRHPSQNSPGWPGEKHRGLRGAGS
jgi:transposase-like protein